MIAADHLVARLLARRSLPRRDREILQLLTDASLRQDVEARLAACGLRLLDHPYADHVTIGIARGAEAAVFEHEDDWQASNVGLPKDSVALLVLLWALIILPKRERQLSRTDADGQAEIFGGVAARTEAVVSVGIAENTLLEDYGKMLGGLGRVRIHIGTLQRLGFIEKKNKMILEGPLLDLAFDYAEIAPRILEGTLASVLRQRQDGVKPDEDA